MANALYIYILSHDIVVYIYAVHMIWYFYFLLCNTGREYDVEVLLCFHQRARSRHTHACICVLINEVAKRSVAERRSGHTFAFRYTAAVTYVYIGIKALQAIHYI